MLFGYFNILAFSWEHVHVCIFSFAGIFGVGFIAGITSYHSTCVEKIMRLENSRLADQVRASRRYVSSRVKEAPEGVLTSCRCFFLRSLGLFEFRLGNVQYLNRYKKKLMGSPSIIFIMICVCECVCNNRSNFFERQRQFFCTSLYCSDKLCMLLIVEYPHPLKERVMLF